MDVPQERGAIIFAQGRPIGRSIVPTVVACTCRCCARTCKTRVKSPPSPSPSPSPPSPNIHISRCPREGERSTRDAFPFLLLLFFYFPNNILLSSLSFYFFFFPSPSVSFCTCTLHPLPRASPHSIRTRRYINKRERESDHARGSWKVLRCKTKVSRQSGCLMWREKGLGRKYGGRENLSKAHPPFPLSLFLSFPFTPQRDGPLLRMRTLSSPVITWFSQCFTFTQRAIHLSAVIKGVVGIFARLNSFPCENTRKTRRYRRQLWRFKRYTHSACLAISV